MPKAAGKEASFSGDEEGRLERITDFEDKMPIAKDMKVLAVSPHELAKHDNFSAFTAHDLGLAEQFWDENYRLAYCQRIIARSTETEPQVYVVSPGTRSATMFLEFVRQRKIGEGFKVVEEFDRVTSEIVVFVTQTVKRMMIHKGFKVERYDPDERDRRG